LLIEVAKRLNTALRDEDTVSRMGGDEFILLLPETNVNGAAKVAQKLLASLTLPFLFQDHELSVTASLGIALYPSDGADIETLSKNADTAMYRAKQEGRNNYCFFTHEMQKNSQRNLKISNAWNDPQILDTF
jgi:diguanylate cyclase (GGDEF)-like protein